MKEFKNLDEQLEILKKRHLSIPDEKIAKDFLLKNNYYRISGYSLTLRNHDVFFKSATFQNIMDIYNFDHEFRHILLEYIEIIEVTIKSIFSYEFTKMYGPLGYLEKENFTDQKIYDKIIGKAEAQKKSSLPHEAFLKHFIEDLGQEVPLWAYVELLTISDISFLYSISSIALQKQIAKRYGLLMNNNYELLGRFLHKITIIRNLCAHGGRLYNRLFQQRPRLSKKELDLLRKNPDGSVDNAHIYGFIFIIKRLLCKEDFEEFKTLIIELNEKYPFVNMKFYGFRADWKEVL